MRQATFNLSKPALAGTRLRSTRRAGQLCSGSAVSVCDGGSRYIDRRIARTPSPEFADLQSNDALLTDIAAHTGGRVLPGMDSSSPDLFSRENLYRNSSSTPLWDWLLAGSMGLMIIDVASRTGV